MLAREESSVSRQRRFKRVGTTGIRALHNRMMYSEYSKRQVHGPSRNSRAMY